MVRAVLAAALLALLAGPAAAQAGPKAPAAKPAEAAPAKPAEAGDYKLEGFRSATFGRPVDVSSLAFSVAVTVVVLLCAAYTFRGMEKSFADVV